MAKPHRTIVEQQMSAYLESSPGKIRGLLFPTAANREAWEGLDGELRERLAAAGEEAEREAWTQIFLSDYREYSRTGNRVHFEDKFFARRFKLTRLVMAECTEGTGRFLDAILDGLFLILEETSWCLPAHNSYRRDQGALAVPDPERPVIDLFAAETGALIGLLEYLLREELARVDASISRTVDAELRKRILEPYLSYHFWWMGDGESPMLNWTPWITQNVLLAVLTREEHACAEADEEARAGSGRAAAENGTAAEKKPTGVSQPEREAVLRQAACSVDFFLDEYGEDGCCDEGAQYYEHAGLCLFGCLDLLNRAAPERSGRAFAEAPLPGMLLPRGAVSGCFAIPLVRNIADYIVKMHVGGKWYINFADCSAHPGRRGAREFLFGKATGNPEMAAFAAADYREQEWEERLLSREQNLYYHILQAFAHGEMMDAGSRSAGGISGAVAGWDPSNMTKAPGYAPADCFFESTGLWIARDGRFTLAAKAGDNGDNHNHNDVGSVILYRNEPGGSSELGKASSPAGFGGAIGGPIPLLIDLGVETYTAKTFSGRRYELWTMQSQYHNLPTFVECWDGEDAMQIMADASQSLNREWTGSTAQCRLVQQRDGEGFAAADVRVSLTEKRAELSMELAPAYAHPGVRSYVRTLTLEKGAFVRIEDAYDGDLPCILSLMTYEKPEPAVCGKPAQGGAYAPAREPEGEISEKRIRIGDSSQLTLTGVSGIRIEECPVTDARLGAVWKHSCWRILARMERDTSGAGRIRMEIL